MWIANKNWEGKNLVSLAQKMANYYTDSFVTITSLTHIDDNDIETVADDETIASFQAEVDSWIKHFEEQINDDFYYQKECRSLIYDRI